MVAGVDDDDVLVVVAVVEAEVHMQHDVRPRKKLDGEVLVVSVKHFAVDVDLTSVSQLLMDRNCTGNRRVMNWMHVW